MMGQEAVLGFSGALVGASMLAAEALSKPPMLLIHGDADEIVPVGALAAAVAGLEAAGIANVRVLRSSTASAASAAAAARADH